MLQLADASTEKPDQENNKSDAKGDVSKDKQSTPADSEVNLTGIAAESKQEVPKTDRQIGPEDLEILEASQGIAMKSHQNH